MKKIKILVASLIIGSVAYAQQAPTGGAGGGAFWRKGGNNIGNGFNIFGTGAGWNSPIYTYTNGTAKTKLNGDLNYNVNGYAGNRNGFMLLGYSLTYSNNLFNTANYGAFSMLHLNGAGGTFVQDGGYRPWMRTGITFTDNDDLSYIGNRKVGNGTDKTETVIVWSDNSGNGFPGPDDMVFRFTAGGNGNTNTSANLTDPADLDGLHVARFTGNGNMGLGPTFGDPQIFAPYVRPQSLMHMSRDGNKQTWLQITNQTGTGQTVNDGLRIGIEPSQTAFIRQQEIFPLIIQSDWDIIPGGTATGERMRISSIAAPGVPNPAGLPTNTTRVAISHQGNNPITQPRSLLHLGYNTGSLLNPASTDGWRDWMDVGTYTNIGTDNIFVGLKRESGGFPANDRHDAVINWGDNGGNNQANGPDMLRFIFTETQTSTIPGNPPATSYNGLEVARFDPRSASTLTTPNIPTTNYGMMGIGDFTVAPQIDAKLDIDGDLRIRQVTQDNTLTQILAIDPTDLNRVHWVDATNLGGGAIGDCTPQNALPFTDDKYMDMNSFNFHFSGNSGLKSENNVAIGSNCNFPLPGKLTVNQNTTNEASTGIYVRNGDNSDATDGSPVSLFAIATGNDLQTGCNTIAGWFEARPSSGQQNIALCVPNSGGVVNIGFATPDLTTPATEPKVCANQLGTLGGLLAVNGPISATGYITNPSDINLKTNIAPIIGALAKVKKLNGVYYDYDNTNYPNLNFSTERQVGLIAQNVDTVLTEVTVFDSSLQAYTLDYSRINALLIEAIKEQDDKVDSLEQLTETQDSINNDLENRLAVLEQCINEANLCSSTSRTTNTINENAGQSIELSNLNAIILDQNLPNPFAENTTITYSIPDDIMEAQLLFYDMNGRIIKQVDITDRGESKLTVYGNNLEKGIYTYSLIADGKLIATKKMVKQ